MQRVSQVLEAPLPKHWRLRQRLKNTLLYGVIRAALWLLLHTPYSLARLALSGLGLLAAQLPLADVRRVREQLAMALPELPVAARERIARAVFVHLARCVAEVTHLERFLDGPKAVRMNEAQRSVLDQALAEGKGVVAVTGHIGNWELLAQVVAHEGYPATSIAKPLYDPRLTRFVHAERTRHGLGLVWRGDDSASKDMMRVFKTNGILALLIDQDTKVQGAFVPFFGRPAYTPTAAAALALRFLAPVVVAWTHRVGDSHVLHFERLPLPQTGDPEADTLILTTTLNARLEAAIRMHPEQWVWMHRRWKRGPAPSTPTKNPIE